MNIKINKERKLAQFIGVPIFVSVLLLFIVFAVPAYSKTVVKESKVVVIKPPRVAAHADLKPNDLPVIFANFWHRLSPGLDEERKKVEALWREIRTPRSGVSQDTAAKNLRDIAKEYIEKENLNLSAVEFWAGSFAVSDDIKLNPPQGGTVSHTWDHCYTKAELEAYKREAIRWAHYIMDVYLPKNFPDKEFS